MKIGSEIDKEKFPNCFYWIMKELGQGCQGTVFKVVLIQQEKGKEILKGYFAANIINKSKIREFDRATRHRIILNL